MIAPELQPLRWYQFTLKEIFGLMTLAAFVAWAWTANWVLGLLTLFTLVLAVCVNGTVRGEGRFTRRAMWNGLLAAIPAAILAPGVIIFLADYSYGARMLGLFFNAPAGLLLIGSDVHGPPGFVVVFGGIILTYGAYAWLLEVTRVWQVAIWIVLYHAACATAYFAHEWPFRW